MTSGAGDEQVAVFDRHRRLLFGVAYQMLGSVADAEDTVQDAWLRWSAADRDEVADPRAYLVRIVSRLALDRLRSARVQRETYVGPWLPEPLLTDRVPGSAPPDPAEAVELGEDVSLAVLVVLETLSPVEREPGGDLDQVGAWVGDLPAVGRRPAQPGVLDDVLGLADLAEDRVGDPEQARATDGEGIGTRSLRSHNR